MRLLLVALLILFSTIHTNSVFAATRLHSDEGHYAFTAGEDWDEIPQEAVKQQLSSLQQMATPGKVPTIAYDFAFQYVLSEHYFEYPYFMVSSYHKRVDSHTPLQWQEQIHSELQASLQRSGMNKLMGNLQPSATTYDPKRRLLTYTVQMDIQGAHGPVRATNFKAIFFGNGIVVDFNFYSTNDEFKHSQPKFLAVIDSFTFDPNYDYLPDYWQRVTTAAIVGAVLALLSGYLLKRRKALWT